MFHSRKVAHVAGGALVVGVAGVVGGVLHSRRAGRPKRVSKQGPGHACISLRQTRAAQWELPLVCHTHRL